MYAHVDSRVRDKTKKSYFVTAHAVHVFPLTRSRGERTTGNFIRPEIVVSEIIGTAQFG